MDQIAGSRLVRNDVLPFKDQIRKPERFKWANSGIFLIPMRAHKKSKVDFNMGYVYGILQENPGLRRLVGLRPKFTSVSITPRLESLLRFLEGGETLLKRWIKENLKELGKVQMQKEDFCSRTKEYSWDLDHPFRIEPTRWIGGAALRYAEKRAARMRELTNKLWQSIRIYNGLKP